MQTTIGLSKFLNSLPLIMQVAHRQSRGLYSECIMGLRVKGEGVNKRYKVCGTNSQQQRSTQQQTQEL